MSENQCYIKIIKNWNTKLNTLYSYIGKPYNESPKYWIGIDANTAPDDILRELTLNSYEIVKAKYKNNRAAPDKNKKRPKCMLTDLQ